MTDQPTVHQPVLFTIVRQQGQISACTTSSALVNHILNVVKATRAYNTWVRYAYGLKTFFAVIPKPPEAIDRRDCLAFMKQQQQEGRYDARVRSQSQSDRGAGFLRG